MIPLRPLAALPTHEVTNMPPHLGDQDLWRDDAALREGVEREGGTWARDRLAGFGRTAGAAETFEKAELANRLDSCSFASWTGAAPEPAV